MIRTVVAELEGREIARNTISLSNPTATWEGLPDGAEGYVVKAKQQMRADGLTEDAIEAASYRLEE